jgi:hypothetical protein
VFRGRNGERSIAEVISNGGVIGSNRGWFLYGLGVCGGRGRHLGWVLDEWGRGEGGRGNKGRGGERESAGGKKVGGM